MAQLAESVRRALDNSTYHYHLGMAYIAAGRLSHAALSLQQALTVDPHFPDAGKAKAALDQIVLSR